MYLSDYKLAAIIALIVSVICTGVSNFCSYKIGKELIELRKLSPNDYTEEEIRRMEVELQSKLIGNLLTLVFPLAVMGRLIYNSF